MDFRFLLHLSSFLATGEHCRSWPADSWVTGWTFCLSPPLLCGIQLVCIQLFSEVFVLRLHVDGWSGILKSRCSALFPRPRRTCAALTVGAGAEDAESSPLESYASPGMEQTGRQTEMCATEERHRMGCRRVTRPDASFPLQWCQ